MDPNIFWQHIKVIINSIPNEQRLDLDSWNEYDNSLFIKALLAIIVLLFFYFFAVPVLETLFSDNNTLSLTGDYVKSYFTSLTVNLTASLSVICVSYMLYRKAQSRRSRAEKIYLMEDVSFILSLAVEKKLESKFKEIGVAIAQLKASQTTPEDLINAMLTFNPENSQPPASENKSSMAIPPDHK
ncbi:hypothetical protein [Leptothoe spongobia]|uniref:Uncharacterized protein n=1 Tax=Leptothoe spongobia TAU-MAC 1115 TaxID=1967444 RepID=A0A947DKJ3_9CYAN|nr:hypothetical protein [Leptothoe spongobia]MBT9318019.1 hypothetical protein [Leptothoe spongobia TAU-MAC 1115]